MSAYQFGKPDADVDRWRSGHWDVVPGECPGCGDDDRLVKQDGHLLCEGCGWGAPND